MNPVRVLYIRPENRPAIYTRIAEVADGLDHAKVWEVVIREYDPKRSLEQNNRYWALTQLAAEVTGHSTDELHEFLLAAKFGTKVIDLGGIKREVPIQRSRTLGKKAFNEYMEFCEAFYAQNLGVCLPELEAV